ncbi:PP2C family protein-serine/threonine phosphatase [Humidisolicoccus flavus]|uniref:PP2C family protein-serine/threonine phosphatase n=1 Tax=Humidisolicoccus flavus TaxID=3111414 RepID=UPI0032555C94
MTHIGTPLGEYAQAAQGTRGFEVRWAGATDTGLRRAHNEDSLVTVPPVFAIADGMGGHAHGDVASKAVVERLAALEGKTLVEPIEIVEALRNATADITSIGEEGDSGTGTTVTGAAFAEHEGEPYFAVFNVGDSRTYAMLGDRLTRITVDHSVVQELVDAGLLSEDEAETHPDSNVVTRAIGFNVDPVPDYFLLPVMPELRIVMCSDGLTKEVRDSDIERLLIENPDTAKAADALVDAALDAGGRDNVTVVVLDVVKAPEVDDVDRTVPRTTLRNEPSNEA